MRAVLAHRGVERHHGFEQGITNHEDDTVGLVLHRPQPIIAKVDFWPIGKAGWRALVFEVLNASAGRSKGLSSAWVDRRGDTLTATKHPQLPTVGPQVGSARTDTTV